MARPKTLPAELATTDFDAAEAANVVAEVQSQGAIVERVQASALAVGQLAGRIESALFLRNCAEKVIAECFLQLKEGKKYKDLELRDSAGNLRRCADLPEACELLFGKSYRVCAELAQNYESLGAELFEAAERIGLRRNEYRALRALPNDDQALVKTALRDATDRDNVAELIEELSERHAKKLGEKNSEIESLKQQVATKERRVSELYQQNDKLKDKLDGMTVSADAARAVLLEKRAQAIGKLRDAALGMLGYVGRFDQAVHDVLALGDPTSADEATATVQATYQRLADLALASGIPVDFAEVVSPSWLAPLVKPEQSAATAVGEA